MMLSFIPPDTFFRIGTNFFPFVVIIFGSLAVLFSFLWGLLRLIFKKNIKTLLFVAENALLILVISLVFYAKYYRPLYMKFYNLMIKKISSQETVESAESSIRGKFSVNPVVPYDIVNQYGALWNAVKAYKGRLFIIDVREKEEFNRRHMYGAYNIRGADITKEALKQNLALTDDEFKKALFLLYCHNGLRSSEVCKRLNKKNIRFLFMPFSVWEPFSSEIVEKANIAAFQFDYDIVKVYVDSKEIKNMLGNGKALVIDGSLGWDNEQIEELLIPYLTTEEYNQKLKNLLSLSLKHIIVIIKDAPEFLFAQIFFFRLEKDYGFKRSSFHISFPEDYEKIIENEDS